jgi:hypothetical protein
LTIDEAELGGARLGGKLNPTATSSPFPLPLRRNKQRRLHGICEILGLSAAAPIGVGLGVGLKRTLADIAQLRVVACYPFLYPFLPAKYGRNVGEFRHRRPIPL